MSSCAREKERFQLAVTIRDDTPVDAVALHEDDIDCITMIRAVQGHSISFVKPGVVQLTQEQAENLYCLVHGTKKRYVDSILASGLDPHQKGRNSVHLAAYPSDDVRCVSGMRKGTCDHWVYLKRGLVAKDYGLYASASGALLVNEKISPSCIDVIMCTPTMGVIYDSAFANAVPWEVKNELGELKRVQYSAYEPSIKDDMDTKSEIDESSEVDSKKLRTQGRKGFACPHCKCANAVGRTLCSGCDGRVTYQKWSQTQPPAAKREGHHEDEPGYGSMSIAIAVDDEANEAGGATLPMERGEKRSLPSDWNLETEFTNMIKTLRKVRAHQRKWSQDLDYRVRCQAMGMTPLFPCPRTFECGWNPQGTHKPKETLLSTSRTTC